MRTAPWSDEHAWHGGYRQGVSSTDLPVFAAGCCGSAQRGGSSYVSVNSFAVGRDGRRGSRVTAASRKRRIGVRRTKVRTVRRQIEQGSYDVDALLAAVFDKVFEDLITTHTGKSERLRSADRTRTRTVR
jgi:hypothetical protein